jgi:hypothetical protein
LTFVFVHLPKTAGTSFRHAFEVEHPGSVLLDYRANSPKTSKAVMRLVYKSDLPPGQRSKALKQYADETGALLLSGHFHSKKYWNAFDHGRFVTILRNPLDRIVSSYNRHVRRGQVSMPFEEFALSREVNLQSKRLEGTPIEEFGFVGLSERFEESLKQFNARFGTNLREFVRSKAPEDGQRVRKADLSPALLKEIGDAHRDDIALYDAAVILYEKRCAAVS